MNLTETERRDVLEGAEKLPVRRQLVALMARETVTRDDVLARLADMEAAPRHHGMAPFQLNGTQHRALAALRARLAAE